MNDVEEANVEELISNIRLHNNSKHRRFKRDVYRVKGPSGTPNPWGSREYRRSKQGKAEIKERIDKLAQYLALQDEVEAVKEELNFHPEPTEVEK